MPTTTEVVRFLIDEGLTDDAKAVIADAPVTNVASVDVATIGSLSWLSEGRHARHPSQAREFSGALLIGPVDAGTMATAGGWSVACRSPKLAFSRAIERFFPELLDWPWPPYGASRAADASIAASARLGPGVIIGTGCVIGDDVEIGPGTALAHTSVARGTRIGAHCSIGLPGFGFDKSADGLWFRFPHIGRVEIGEEVEIGSNTCVDRGALGATIIARGAKIDNLVHVAHNVRVGEDALVIALAMLGGSATIGAGAWVAPAASIKNQVRVGAGATIGMGAVVIGDVADNTTVAGVPAKELVKRGN